eukprot:scaffold114449_cov72-Phaeocystis_antarctica.AAC.3
MPSRARLVVERQQRACGAACGCIALPPPQGTGGARGEGVLAAPVAQQGAVVKLAVTTRGGGGGGLQPSERALQRVLLGAYPMAASVARLLPPLCEQAAAVERRGKGGEGAATTAAAWCRITV